MAGIAGPVREHLLAGLDYQDRLARFLENHDEPRAAATFAPAVHQAAAVITFLTPGLRFFHQGQREGKRVRIPIHLARGPVEAPDEAISAFYDSLVACLNDPAFRIGRWQLVDARPAWEGNGSNDAFVVFAWSGPADHRRLVAVNYAGHQSQCYVIMPWDDLAGRTWRLHDRMGEVYYDRDGADLSERGLYLDMPAWGYHAFEVTSALRHDWTSTGRHGMREMIQLCHQLALWAHQTISTLPDDFTGQNFGAGIKIAPSGRFVYASNRGHDSLAIYAADQGTGAIGAGWA